MQANYANTLCHFNATPLSVAVLAPCAWGESVVCGVAWQSVLLGRNGAWQGALNLATHNTAWRGEFGSETAQHNKIQWHDNKIQHNEFIKASTANGAHSTTDSTKYGEFSNTNSEKRYFMGKTMHGDTANSAWQVWQNGRCLWAKQAKRKWSSVWAGDFSLVARTFWHTKIFKRFVFGLLRPFCHFEPFAKRRKIQRIESALAILGYFANAQYGKQTLVILSFRRKRKIQRI